MVIFAHLVHGGILRHHPPAHIMGEKEVSLAVITRVFILQWVGGCQGFWAAEFYCSLSIFILA